MNDWHGDIDKNGNTECLKCKTKQSAEFKSCINCCKHDHLEFNEDYDCGWRLVLECSDCGLSGFLKNIDAINNYKVVKK